MTFTTILRENRGLNSVMQKPIKLQAFKSFVLSFQWAIALSLFVTMCLLHKIILGRCSTATTSGNNSGTIALNIFIVIIAIVID